MPQINAQRLLADLDELRGFGATGTGVVRPSLSPVDMAARRWLVKELGDAGLDAVIDAVGTVYGRSRNAGKALLIGSHTDTQMTGGWLDGAMGVIYGLEIARALSESPQTAHLAVDVASWADEEGTYLGMLGSRSFCDELSPDMLAAGTNRDGQLLTDALREVGLEGGTVVRLDTQRTFGYLEAHIEQGPYLEYEKKRIGVVTSIIGMRDFDIDFTGQQNHAGTTPMALRRDAGAALIEFSHALQTAFHELIGERTVFTIGRVNFCPGAPSIIPGRAEMVLQFRDPEESVLDRLEDCARQLVAKANECGRVAVRLSPRDNDTVAVLMDENFQSHLARACAEHAPEHWVRMPSGAAHDAQLLARHIPAGMLFVPSIGGISHDFAEDTRREDIALGCQVMADAAASLLLEHG